jgi:Ca2+-binding RTX toxin-like protein
MLTLLCLAVPATAGASSADFSGGHIEIGNGDGQNNAMGVFFDGAFQRILVTDTVAISAGSAACIDEGSTISCPAGATDIFVGLGTGNDTFQNTTPIFVFAVGGAGEDGVTGGSGDDILVGGEGKDLLVGGLGDDFLADEAFFLFGFITGSGNDTFKGGAGDDRMDAGGSGSAGAGQDVFNGEAEVDTLDASARTVPLTITEGNGIADDGASGEGDNVINAEIILGGTAGDSITGGSEVNEIDGGPGDDTLAGGGGADQLIGGEGSDTATYAGRVQPVIASLDGKQDDGEANEFDFIATDVEGLTGGSGADNLGGSTGADRIDGGPGADTIDALGGADTVSGGAGGDTIQARDGAPDNIACGSEVDSAAVDTEDTVSADCENVDRPAVPNTNPADVTGPKIALLATAKLADGKVTVGVSCPAGEPTGCKQGKLTLKLGKTMLARGKFTAAAGKTVKVKLAIPQKLRSRLYVGKRVSLTASATDQAGNPGSATRLVRLKA